ncbi:MAG: hypothetical protein ACRDKL_06825 [Solirubrobacteraceae bacterium]
MASDDVTTESAKADGESDDSNYGWAMFLAFICAAMSITFAVCVLTLVKTWWMLGVAMVVHVSITATMLWVILGAFRSAAYKHERKSSGDAAPPLKAAHV